MNRKNIKKRVDLTYAKNIEILNKLNTNVSVYTLTKEYNASKPTIYDIK